MAVVGPAGSRFPLLIAQVGRPQTLTAEWDEVVEAKTIKPAAFRAQAGTI